MRKVLSEASKWILFYFENNKIDNICVCMCVSHFKNKINMVNLKFTQKRENDILSPYHHIALIITNKSPINHIHTQLF